MNRKLVFFLTGFLTISSVSAGLPSLQAAAAEASESSSQSQQAQVSFTVMDENQILLSDESPYSLKEGETRTTYIFWDELPTDTLPSYTWTSASSDIVSITEDGTITALSSGTGRIVLTITGDTQIETTEYTVIVEAPEEAEAVEETVVETESTEEAAPEEAEAVEETAEEAAPLEAEVVEETLTEEAPEQIITTEEEIPEESVVTETAVVAANAKAAVTVSEQEPSKIRTGWVKDGDQYRYLDQDGVALTGWQTIGGYRYYLDPQTSARVTGIQSIDGKLYVFSTRGVRYNGTRLVETSKGQCFVTKDGLLATGWVQYNNNWYYFKQNGLMKTGKLVLDGKTYWLGKDGVMRTGWYRGNGYLYYLDRKTGAAAVGWKQLSGRKYLFSRNGVMRKGWYKPTGRMFYMGKDGYVLSGLKKIGTAKYYLRLDGAITNGWKKIGKYWYYFKSCKACTGWLTLGSQKYYLTQNGVMVTGTHTIDGVSYSFAPDGALRPSTNNYHNTEEFIACIAPLVQKYAPKYGVKVVSPIIAQAILESASGESSLGKKYNNFFGLKCGTLWTGKSVNLLTGEEYTVGHYTTITAAFRVYDNMEEGVKGYFEFLFRNRTRYNNLIGETDPYRYLEKIKADGYATSSQYVTNTYNVLKRYNLTRFDRK